MRLTKFKNHETITGKNGLTPLIDVCTRWGSTFAMLQRAIQCKSAQYQVLLDDDLTEFVLKEVEWRSLTSLKDLLSDFDTLTTKVCASKTYPTITTTITVYNRLMEIIEDYIKNNENCHPDIYCGAKAAYEKLGKYYAATDNSPI